MKAAKEQRAEKARARLAKKMAAPAAPSDALKDALDPTIYPLECLMNEMSRRCLVGKVTLKQGAAKLLSPVQRWHLEKHNHNVAERRLGELAFVKVEA